MRTRDIQLRRYRHTAREVSCASARRRNRARKCRPNGAQRVTYERLPLEVLYKRVVYTTRSRVVQGRGTLNLYVVMAIQDE